MKLIILDRDGVINYDSDEYIKSVEEWRAIPGSLDAIARLYHAGYHVVVASNQAGIARGKFNIDTLNSIHQKMHTHLAQYGGVIGAIFFCPHGPDDGCECRKPKPGLLREVARRLNTPLDGVYAVGDKLSDLQAASAAGAVPILVKTGYGQSVVNKKEVPAGVEVYNDLAEFVDELLTRE
jgi:D-glycero-D-manno-heptose 1,7-bisphosphate phosphatase